MSPMKSLHVLMLMGHREATVKSYMRSKDADVISDYVMHEADLLTVGPRKRLEKENAELKKDYLLN
jgi:hypothetical protein